MKPLKLTFEAFGPYLEKTEVDFEPLYSDSLFLISGSTGGGKTTIFDAICMALYCRSTGDKRSFLDMRCNRAEKLEPSLIDFEFSLEQEKYRFVRSLVYRKKRGSDDFVLEQSHECFRFIDNDWHLLKAGAESVVRACAEEIIGLDNKQFSKVIVLPQGDFQSFLLASSKEKGQILQTLFGAELWEKVKDLARKRDRELDLKLEKYHNDIMALLAQNEFERPEELDEKIEELAKQYEILLKQSESTKKESEKATKESSAANEFLRLLKAKADAELKLQQAQEEHKIANEKLPEAEKGLGQAVTLDKERIEAERAATLLLAELKKLEQLDAEQENIAKAKNETRLIENSIKSLEKSAKENTDSIEKAKPYLEEADKALSELPLLKDQQISRKSIIDAHATLAKCKGEHEKAQQNLEQTEAELVSVTTRSKALSEQLEQVDAVLETNKALELAAELKPNEPCPVCGSTEHPAPTHSAHVDFSPKEISSLRADALTERDKLSATQSQLTAAKEQRARLADELEAAQLSLNALLENKDVSIEDISKEYEKVTEEIALKEKRVAQRSQMNDKYKMLLASKDELTAKISEQKSKLASLMGAIENTEANIKKAQAEMSTTEKTALEKAYKEKNEKIKRISSKIEELRSNHTKALEAVTQSKTQLKISKEELIKATEIYGNFESRWNENSLPDSEALQAKTNELREAALELSNQVGEIKGELNAAKTTKSSIKALQESMKKAEENGRAIKELAGQLAGSNVQKTPISTYVVSIMFEEVIACANRFFTSFSSGRYALQRSDDGEGGNAYKGLGLQILDGATGTLRAVETLSGGEQFLASLSLAFGLSEIVQSMSGAVRTESIFIDEGFGSLDSETLDTAMKALEIVKSSGRLVGIISHVSELKSRISAGIEVTTSAEGLSSLKVKV